MARLSKRERANRKAKDLVAAAQREYSATIQGTSKGYAMSNFIAPVGKPSRQWEWDWKADRRINHGGKWND